MGCDNVGYITWLMVSDSWVKRTKNLLVPHKVIFEPEITTIFSRTNLGNIHNTRFTLGSRDFVDITEASKRKYFVFWVVLTLE
jgi:hypothetical protein